MHALNTLMVALVATTCFGSSFATATQLSVSGRCEILGLDAQVRDAVKGSEFRNHPQALWFVMDTILTDERAVIARVYECMTDRLRIAFQHSDEPSARVYRSFDRVNARSFYSPVNDYSFANVYVNALASDYTKNRFEKPFPQGSILAKETFVVSPQGQVSVGPMFVMEKMVKGYSRDSGDWRFVKVFPDGRVESDEVKSETITESCLSCHARRQSGDYLFYLEIVSHFL